MLFRELTEEEISFVAGGDYNDNYGWTITGGSGFGWGGGSGGGGSGGGSDTSAEVPNGPPPPPIVRALTSCEEREVDNLAWQWAQNLPNNTFAGTEYEYGSIIYRDNDGSIKMTAYQTDYSTTDITFRIPEHIGYRGVIALIHNHPTETNGGGYDVDIANRQPSPGDWDSFDLVAREGGTQNVLRDYIIGPDQHLRQYDKNSTRGQVSTDEVFGQTYC